MRAILAVTHHPLYGPWVRGQLTLAAVDPRTPLDRWLDAIYATLAAAPHEVLPKLNDQFVINAVRADPEGARRTWGALPEHQLQPSAEEVFSDAEQ